MKKITVLIPCYNEAKGIALVIKDVPIKQLKAMGFTTEILVIDNNSTDKTAKIAEAAGARVITETKKGKGNAMRTGFASVSADTDIVVMLDGDNTYKAYEIPRLIEPIASGFADVIVGSRLEGKMMKDSLKYQNLLVNRGFALLVRKLYGANVSDVLSGFFAWKKSAADGMNAHLCSEGFSIEMEMITKMVKLGYSMYCVPITYDVRKGETKINPIADGLAILNVLIKNLFWKPKNPGKRKAVFTL